MNKTYDTAYELEHTTLHVRVFREDHNTTTIKFLTETKVNTIKLFKQYLVLTFFIVKCINLQSQKKKCK